MPPHFSQKSSNNSKSIAAENLIVDSAQRRLQTGLKSANLSWLPFIAIGIILSFGAAVALNLLTTVPQFLVLGGVVGLFLVLIIFQNPEIGGYLLIFTVFTNMSDLFTEKGLPSVNKPLIAITIFSIVMHYLLRSEKRLQIPTLTRTEVLFLAYLLVIGTSALIATDQSIAFNSVFDLMKDVAVGLCVLITLNTKAKLKMGVATLILAVAFVSFLGVIKIATGYEQTFWGFAQNSAFGQVSDSGVLRYGGPIGESNVWAQVLAATLPLVIYQFAKRSETLPRIAMLVFTLFIFLALLFTQSRGAILALFIVLPLMAFEMRIKGPTLLTIAIIGSVILFVVPTKYTERIRNLQIFFQTDQEYGLTQDESVAGRREKMLTGLAMFRANPFLGVGFGNYNTNYWEYAGQLGLEASATDIQSERGAREPHSLYIEIMSETGLLGILTFATFFGLLFWNLYKARKQILQGSKDTNWSIWITSISFAIISFLASGFFLHGIRFRYLWVLLGLAFSILYISKQITDSRLNDKFRNTIWA